MSEKENCENILDGIISKIEEDESNVKIVVDIGAHDKVVSVMSREDVESIVLCEGNTIKLMIKSNDLMLGK